MNILLTSGARRIDFIGFFQEALKEAGILGNVIVADPDYNAPSLQVADRSYIIPHQTDDKYAEKILDICKEDEIEMLIPLNDWEVPKLAENKAAFDELGVKLFIPDYEVVKKVRDKGRYQELLGEIGLKAPNTYFTIEDVQAAINNGKSDFPFIVKPRNGSASIGIEVVNNMEELKSAYQLAVHKIEQSPLRFDTEKDPEDNVIIQEVIEGEKYSLDIVNDLEGKFLTSLARKQLAMRGGDVDRTITSQEKPLVEIGKKIGDHFKHNGYLNTDVFYDGKDYYIIDINPRFGGGYAFSHEAGADIPAAFIALAAGKPVDFEWLTSTPDVELARYDLVTKINEGKLNNQAD
ncbi:ATP-grasp domain-containing protein [Sediminibacillus halophilus]|uniref:Carbamoyl-phosphate synthase large subunit n=1 Tax=Sediminibacillus halophilus TaxID=482461 RepID=A0A1G9SZI5_9BACI|nr:ATP-grasp domain-containing protein [Sediminibacillus halophilus]SDM40808.1 carbamoyl-phosphate synthase large subunit [Sediminibacillus halophilus]